MSADRSTGGRTAGEAGRHTYIYAQTYIHTYTHKYVTKTYRKRVFTHNTFKEYTEGMNVHVHTLTYAHKRIMDVDLYASIHAFIEPSLRLGLGPRARDSLSAAEVRG